MLKWDKVVAHITDANRDGSLCQAMWRRQFTNRKARRMQPRLPLSKLGAFDRPALGALSIAAPSL
jgi:hypothetical protein